MNYGNNLNRTYNYFNEFLIIVDGSLASATDAYKTRVCDRCCGCRINLIMNSVQVSLV